ncbi:hypothetical protein EG68_03314 [Paragonimus skrjabini miyazakii]|uniref:UBC core domain-containing protein n=1 Tax=Paragonimus skrjabini miyazakii TaxID=59628 RepID=A0A8S9YWH6_9TREM|nr:hypothetical protein EG68_03314 [Paragonimus skrjabini miyazakii]
MKNWRRRTFVRDFYDLMLSVEKDEQLKIVDYDEQNLTQFFISVTPSDGLYAHAQFIFQITSPDVYPEEPPKVRCITPIFHPNIDDPSRNGETCINLFNYWNKGFSLKDVANAVLFLFYRPNFDDPLNSSVPDEGETVVDCILQSLNGGEIHGVHYAPNKAWCAWREQNPKASIFGQHSVPHKILEWQSGVTDNPDSLLNEMEKSPYMNDTDKLNTTEMEKQLEDYSDETALYKNILKPRHSQSTEVSSGISTHSTLWSAEILEDERCDGETENEGNESNEEDPGLFHTVEAQKYDITWYTLNSEEQPYVSRCYFAQSCRMNKYLSYRCGPHENPDQIVHLDGLLTTLQKGQHQTWKPEHCNRFNGCLEKTNTASSVDVEQAKHVYKMESRFINNLSPMSWSLRQTRWPAYCLPNRFVTHCLFNSSAATTVWPRASAMRLFMDLNHRMSGLNKVTQLHLILVDPLALSPFSPIFNRMVTAAVSIYANNSRRYLLSIEWLTVWESLFSPVPNSSRRPYKILSISALSVCALLSNWLCWFSRMELYHYTLGYSRPGMTAFSCTRRVTDPFALCCLDPASLGLGQAAVCDAWPLWLVCQLSRTMCDLLGRFTGYISHHFYEGNFNNNPDLAFPKCSIYPTRIYFPFSDVDEI